MAVPPLRGFSHRLPARWQDPRAQDVLRHPLRVPLLPQPRARGVAGEQVLLPSRAAVGEDTPRVTGRGAGLYGLGYITKLEFLPCKVKTEPL